MHPKPVLRCFFVLILVVGLFNSTGTVQARGSNAPAADVTAYELIAAMNALRVGNGYSALIEDPIIDAVAQSTAEYMAAYEMSSHIGNVKGRISAAGYGGGGTVWATENFAVGFMTLDEIMVVWADASHMLPATEGSYCNVGAGVAESSSGRMYYILQAAYVSGKECGSYTSSGGTGSNSGDNSDDSDDEETSIISQLIVPVTVATPDADGNIYHIVQSGQSLWSIAIAYGVTIKAIQAFNNLASNTSIQSGEKLYIPGENTKGYATPTPVGQIQVSTPDKDGKIIHVVQAYQTLSTIADAYGVSVKTIQELNYLTDNSILQIDEQLIINKGNVTPSPTPRPLTPIEKLTPDAEGKYYHAVANGESLSSIADLYSVKLADLMTWNGLNASSVLQPGQKLLLQVTPPATQTPTLAPPTETPTLAPTKTPTISPTPSPVVTQTPVEEEAPNSTARTAVIWFVSIGLALGGLFLGVMMAKKKN